MSEIIKYVKIDDETLKQRVKELEEGLREIQKEWRKLVSVPKHFTSPNGQHYVEHSDTIDAKLTNLLAPTGGGDRRTKNPSK